MLQSLFYGRYTGGSERTQENKGINMQVSTVVCIGWDAGPSRVTKCIRVGIRRV